MKQSDFARDLGVWINAGPQNYYAINPLTDFLKENSHKYTIEELKSTLTMDQWSPQGTEIIRNCIRQKLLLLWRE